MALGLAAALALAERRRALGWVRVALLVPLGVPTIVAASAMRYIFGTVGYLNEVLYRLGVIDLPIDWTGSRWLAVVTVAVADAWKVTPLVMLILLAGLQAIPRQLYEAARTDGATPWQQFRRITLPLLRPAITMALIVRGVDAFRIFALPAGADRAQPAGAVHLCLRRVPGIRQPAHRGSEQYFVIADDSGRRGRLPEARRA